MARIGKIAALVAVLAFGWALARPAPRVPNPLKLGTVAPRIGDVRDGGGRVVLADVRAIEDNVFYVGGALPSGTHVDDTAFQFLKKRNVGLVITLSPDEQRYYAEDGYLRYWAGQTGHHITTRWLPVPADHTYALSEHGALHAAAEVLSVFKRDWPMTAAVYLYGDDRTTSRDAREIVVAAYELWRNRGWDGGDARWSQVERRFLEETAAGDAPTILRPRLEAFRGLRRQMEYLGEI